MGVEVNMSVYSTLYLVPSKKRLQVNALLQHGKKSGKGFKVCKKEDALLCAAVKNNDVDGLLTRVEQAQMVDVQIHEEIIV